MQCSTKSLSTIPSTCISLTAALASALKKKKNAGSDLSVVQTERSVHVTASDSHSPKRRGRSWPHNQTHFYFFQWAEHSLSARRGPRQNAPCSSEEEEEEEWQPPAAPMEKQSRGGTASTKSSWQAEFNVVGRSTLSTFYFSVFRLVSRFPEIKKTKTDLDTFI